MVVLCDFLVKLVDALRDCERLAGEGAVARLQVSGTECSGEGLVDFVVCQLLGLARVLGLLIGCSGGSEGLSGLPGFGADDGFAA